MAKPRKTTQELLLETAAELFAEYGFKGTSVKMIAEKAKQNIAAVNYHFGSKQNLFIQTLKTVLANVMTPVETQSAADRPITATTLASNLQQFVFARCRFLFSDQTPTWYGRLIARAVFEVPSSVQEMGLEFFSPDFDYLENLARSFHPQLSQERAKLWAYSVVGQIFFYVFGRNMIVMANQPVFFAPEKIELIAEHVCAVSLAWFNQN